MSGNVWEWCQDWKVVYPSSHQINPTGPSIGSIRVFRGGSWFYDSKDCRVTNRDGYASGFQIDDVGFRLVKIP